MWERQARDGGGKMEMRDLTIYSKHMEYHIFASYVIISIKK